jgi:hypothetical protein
LYIGNSRLPGNDFIKGKKKLVIIYRWSIIPYYHHRYFLLSNYLMFLISTPYFLMSTVVCVLVYMLQWTILLRIPLIIVLSRLRMPNGFTTKKTCLSIQWVVTSKSLTNYNHCCLTWTNKVKAIVLKLASMKLLTKSATSLNVLLNKGNNKITELRTI